MTSHCAWLLYLFEIGMPCTVTNPMLERARLVVLYTEGRYSVTETHAAHRVTST